jgi:RNA polymerase sigma factor (sigma-70 family)
MRSSITIVSESDSSSTTPATAEEAADFQSVRPRLFGIAYRLLGRVSDAEDVVQDVWVRWQGADRAQVRDRVALLVKITTRLALNVAVSARSRREVSVDSWFPAQALASEDPTAAVERSADLEQAVLLLLQRLSPIERAVFVLREAFDYPFRDIAGALGISEANARQLGRRARMHLLEQRHAPVHRATRDRLLRAFLDATQAGAVARLEHLLAADALPHSDRGREVA